MLAITTDTESCFELLDQTIWRAFDFECPSRWEYMHVSSVRNQHPRLNLVPKGVEFHFHHSPEFALKWPIYGSVTVRVVLVVFGHFDSENTRVKRLNKNWVPGITGKVGQEVMRDVVPSISEDGHFCNKSHSDAAVRVESGRGTTAVGNKCRGLSPLTCSVIS